LLGGGEELVLVFGCLAGGGVLVVVGVVTLGHVSLMLDTPAGSFRVEGDTPGGRW
jgi:hypothetical protein